MKQLLTVVLSIIGLLSFTGCGGPTSREKDEFDGLVKTFQAVPPQGKTEDYYTKARDKFTEFAAAHPSMATASKVQSDAFQRKLDDYKAQARERLEKMQKDYIRSQNPR